MRYFAWWDTKPGLNQALRDQIGLDLCMFCYMPVCNPWCFYFDPPHQV